MDNRQLVPLVEFEKGWNNRADLKNSPGFSIMENVVLTDRGGVATRPGTKIFGATDTANGYVTSLFTAKTRGGANIMMRASDTVLEYYNTLTNSWALLKAGFTTAQVFDFFDHNRGKIAGSIDNNFYTYFCNAKEPYSRWRNEAWGKTTTALAGTSPIDSYALTNQDAETVFNAVWKWHGQTFNSGAGGVLDRCVLKLRRSNSPTGNIVFEIFAVTGTSGSTGKPTGSALATADAIAINTVDTVSEEVTFTFTGANKITLPPDTDYCFRVYTAGTDDVNTLRMGCDNPAPTPTHHGNYFMSLNGSTYVTSAANDVVFEMYVDAETAIPVDSTLTDEVFYAGTASSVSTTAITISASDWAVDAWNTDFVVRITSGAQDGEVRAVTDTTATEITFDTIAGLSGTPTFEIRMLKYPASGTIINGNTGTTEAYTAITKDDELTSAGVVNAHAENAPIALVPVVFPSAPRGNILTTLFGQVFLAGDKRFPTTLYRSKIDDASSFDFSATRLAGEGDVMDINEAKPGINDLNTYEDQLIVGGESYMEQIVFTQDENDLPNRKPIVSSSLVGPAGRSSKMRDDLLFANKNKEITSLARVVNQDTRPLSRDIGWSIKRAIKDYDFTSARTWTFKQYSFVACKESADSDTNDVVIVYDNNRGVWIGKWNLPASMFTECNNTLYMGSSASREVYEMLTDKTAQDKGGGDLIGYATKCATGWLNYTKDKVHQQIFNTVCVEGYVKLNTPITFKLFYDWNNQPNTQWTWTPSDNSQQILNATSEEVLGVTEQGVTPLGVELIDEDDEITDNKRFIVYFKVQQTPHTYVKIQWETDGVNQYCELTNISANIMPVENIKEDYITDVETTS